MTISKDVLVVTPKGEVRTEQLDGTLAQQQAWVGGLIERVELPSLGGVSMWVNEESAFMEGLSENVFAIALYEDEYGQMPYPIRGSVYFTGGVDDEGDTLGLSAEQMAQVQRLAMWFIALQLGEEMSL